MFGTTGRYSVEFRHRAPGTWERHRFLNSDDLASAHRGFDESVRTVQRIRRVDVVGIRLMDNVTSAVVRDWSAA